MLPNTFVEIWKNTKIVGRAKHNSSLIFYGDKAALVELQLSDDVNCMFYGYKWQNVSDLRIQHVLC
jgi:hypothetical protein